MFKKELFKCELLRCKAYGRMRGYEVAIKVGLFYQET